jgi:hypothetical protein
MVNQNKNWREIRRELPLNETQMAIYKRLMDAETRLDDIRRRRGVRDTALGDALEQSEDGGVQEIYLSTLARYVAELGGYIEIRAVFPAETITVWGEREGELWR